MKIKAGDLQATNVGQLVQVSKPLETVIGKLDRLKLFRDEDGTVHTVTLRVSGETWQADAEDEIEVWRSPELSALVRVRKAIEDLADDLLDDEDDVEIVESDVLDPLPDLGALDVQEARA